MDNPNNSRAQDVVAEAEAILKEAMGARRRYAADLARHRREEQAFERARIRFHQRYSIAYGNSLRTGASAVEANVEALNDALEMFWACALLEAQR